MSGSTGMPLSRRIWSPSGVVGPLAASTTTLQLSVCALAAVMTPPMAAGMSTSQGWASSSAEGKGVPSLKSTRRLPLLTCDLSFLMSSPLSLCSAPDTSLTATTLPPISCRMSAAHAPTLPKPWMTYFMSLTWPMCDALSSSLMANTVPRPVAASRPREPCRYTGLPVTTPGEKPLSLEYSSKNQAMTRASVFMSGAGMSSYVPMISLMATTSLRVSFSSSLSLSFLGSTVMPPLAPPKGMSITAVFQVISDAKLRTSSMSTWGW
mmetsp:Transcript_37421/g.94440  ORF Transcript_37421/g.94440 Transcript_37421/m.94440 type:complete len:265 (+) Transcript_37421:771-1565(+)